MAVNGAGNAISSDCPRADCAFTHKKPSEELLSVLRCASEFLSGGTAFFSGLGVLGIRAFEPRDQ